MRLIGELHGRGEIVLDELVECLNAHRLRLDTEIRQFCREQMAGYKVPKFVVFGSIAKSATGKIQKFRLRELAKDVESAS